MQDSRKNNPSFLEVYAKPHDDIQKVAAEVGYISMLIRRSNLHKNFRSFHLVDFLFDAICQRNVKIYFNAEGKPVAYVAWAFLDPSVERRIIRTGSIYLSADEWNEGESLWIMDLLSPDGNIKYVLRDLRDVVFKDHQSIRYFRARNEKHIFKELKRSEKSYFLSQVGPDRQSCCCGRIDCPLFIEDGIKS